MNDDPPPGEGLSRFTGFVMTGDVPGGRAGAEIDVTPSGIVARTRSHGDFRLAYSDTKFDRGGASGRMTFLRSATSDLIVGSESKGFDAAIRDACDAATLARFEHAIAGEQARRSRAVWTGWKVFLGCVAFVAVLFAALAAGAPALVRLFPRSVDVAMGDAFHASLAPTLRIEKVAAVDEALARIVARLVPHADVEGFEIVPMYVDSELVNAMALPGGRIFVFRGLIETLDDADELAGVMAHEIAHVELRHHLSRAGSSLGVTAILRVFVGDYGGIVQSVGELAGLLATQGWSRDDESAADREAVRICAAAGIDPLALERAFGRMQAADAGSRGQHEIPKWFGSHPPTEDRRAAVRDAAAEETFRRGAPLDVDYAAIRAALRR